MKTRYFYHQYFIVFCLFFLFQDHSNSKEYTLSDITRVENQAIANANREKIKDWHIRVSLSDEQIDPSSEHVQYILGEEHEGQLIGIEFYKDGNLYREDKSYIYKEKRIVSTTILGEKWVYRFGRDFVRKENTNIKIPLLDMITKEKQENMIMVANEKKENKMLGFFCDIRAFGFVPINLRALVKMTDLTQYVGNPKRKDLFMEDDIVRGEPCYKISFSKIKHPDKNNIAIWISPSHGYNPLRFEFFFPDIPGTKKSIIDLEVNKDKKSGIWFPATQRTTILQNEKLLYQCNTKIEVISLNKKLDPNLFNEKGLNLPIGTIVMMNPEPAPDTYTWDGEKIVGLRGATLEPDIPTRSNAFPYFLIAAGLALISIACLFKYFELRKKK
jgi:hypothetical protein